MSMGEGEWTEIELTADTGACDSVMPMILCPDIPIVPSPQSQRGMEYEVANAATIPCLGERRLEVWTEGANAPRGMAIQGADGHKPLLSLSRCADIGYESRFGSYCGYLIDTHHDEVNPLERKGNLYVLRAWVRQYRADQKSRQTTGPNEGNKSQPFTGQR